MNEYPRVVVTGGIACGKSLFAKYLREDGFETLDADDIVHELIPAEERQKLAKKVFADPEERRKLEEKIHPLVRERLKTWKGVAIIPLLFEAHWDAEYDIICCIASKRETQILRMIETRGYTREEAEARLAAQMPVEEKAKRSHYVVNNDGDADALKAEALKFTRYLKEKSYGR